MAGIQAGEGGAITGEAWSRDATGESRGSCIEERNVRRQPGVRDGTRQVSGVEIRQSRPIPRDRTSNEGARLHSRCADPNSVGLGRDSLVANVNVARLV